MVKPVVKRARIDYTLPLDWIQQHLSELRKLLEEISKLYLPDLKRRIRSERSFRSSVLKKEPVVQPLATNLHYQLLGIRKHCVACIDAHAKPPEILHSVTCGALTPHQLGHKAGGLSHQETILIQEKEKILQLKEKYLQKLPHFGQTGIRIDSEHSPYHLLQEIGRTVQDYEAKCLSVGKRRLLAISQALSVAMNALLLKLNLLLAEQIPHAIANRWVESGFLLVFEGLLSVVGNERSMLEDTIAAVDALRSYQVRIVSNSQEGLSQSSSKREDSTKASLEDQQLLDIDFDMKGREILVFLSQGAIERLTETFRQLLAKNELVLRFYPVLFTQV